jgi:hypothetical protein
MTAPSLIRFRVCHADTPETTLAEVVFTVSADGDTGSLDVRTEDAALCTLVLYYLADPRDMRPVYIHGVGQRHGPHTRSAEQFCLAMSAFGSSFSAFRAVPVFDEAGGAHGHPADVDPTTMRAPASRWADLRSLLSDFSVERGTHNEEGLAGVFDALAGEGPPSTRAREDAELLATGAFRGIPIRDAGEGGGGLRLRAIANLVWSFGLIDAALGAAVGDEPGPRARALRCPPTLPETLTRLPASLPAAARGLGALALAWKAQWEFCSDLVQRDAVLRDDVAAEIARSRATGSVAREMLLAWSCSGGACEHRDPSWHLDDIGREELSVALQVAAAALLARRRGA